MAERQPGEPPEKQRNRALALVRGLVLLGSAVPPEERPVQEERSMGSAVPPEERPAQEKPSPVSAVPPEERLVQGKPSLA